MDNKVKEITISSKDLLEVLQIIHTIKKVNVEKNDLDEVLWLDEINYQLLDSLETTDSSCTVKLNTKDRFAVWLCIDTYKEFLLDTNVLEDVPYITNLQSLFKK